MFTQTPLNMAISGGFLGGLRVLLTCPSFVFYKCWQVCPPFPPLIAVLSLEVPLLLMAVTLSTFHPSLIGCSINIVPTLAPLAVAFSPKPPFSIGSNNFPIPTLRRLAQVILGVGERVSGELSRFLSYLKSELSKLLLYYSLDAGPVHSWSSQLLATEIAHII